MSVSVDHAEKKDLAEHVSVAIVESYGEHRKRRLWQDSDREAKH